MDVSCNDMLGELANDAALERTEFRFMEPGPGSFVQRVDFGLARAERDVLARRIDPHCRIIVE